MDSTIQKFILSQKAASLCCVDDAGHPYCFTCFYAFNAEEGLLFFKTSAASHHTEVMLQNSSLAGTIMPDKLNALAIQGVQWEGRLLPPQHQSSKRWATHYYKRFPFALAMPGDVYAVQIDHIKMTDNTKGFGTKIHWYRNEVTELA